MRFSAVAAPALLAASQAAVAAAEAKIAPKVMIISMFSPEADVWYENLPSSGLGDLLAENITTPGLSMIYPGVHCTASHEICQFTTGESEINAASTVMAAVLSPRFDLTSTYFMIAGIAGVSPKVAALGSVALSRYAVQVALQYEFDAREMPANWTTGYFGFDTDAPDVYPGEQYGTEVFEVNAALRDVAFALAGRANLSVDATAAAYGQKYAAEGAAFRAATLGPRVVKCESATSDVYYSGTILGTAFENVTRIWTNGTGEYCMTAQEDNATLEVLVRMAIAGLVDFSRVIVMRTASDFDRPPPGISAFDNLVVVDQNGFGIAIDNIYLAGIEIVKGILDKWDCSFKKGIKAENYIGDIFGSLGGEPDFGPGSITDGEAVKPGLAKRNPARKGGMKKRGPAFIVRKH
ncbi:purine nucleoside permease-domain-containing protein [Xylariaceae sp. FL0804]|nr:purine nucleoside permease-domain-containing protein [Xylariaceae sp. FL0804]